MRFRTCDLRVLPRRPREWLEHGAEREGLAWWGAQDGTEIPMRLLWVVMPYTHPRGSLPIHALPARLAGEPPIPDVRAQWIWDGDPDRPTLTPSIVCGPGGAPYWHGFIREGRAEAANNQDLTPPARRSTLRQPSHGSGRSR